jgi:hypothetical protein
MMSEGVKANEMGLTEFIETVQDDMANLHDDYSSLKLAIARQPNAVEILRAALEICHEIQRQRWEAELAAKERELASLTK